MNRTIFKAIYALSVLTLLSSCKPQRIQPFSLTIVVSGNFPGLRNDSLLPIAFQQLVTYYEGSCDSILFIPNVEFIRSDISPDKIKFVQELSSINNFRKSLNLLSASNLREDYDEMQSKWKAPGVLYYKSKLSDDSASIPLPSFEKTFIVPLNLANPDTIEKVRSEIASLLCNGKNNGNYGIIFTSNIVKLSADKALSSYLIWKRDSIRTFAEIDSCIRKLEIEYPNDYRFTLEKLKNLTQDGNEQLKKGSEWIILQLIEKAINEGKADSVRKILESWRRKPVIVKPGLKKVSTTQIDPKVYISFQSISLQEQLNKIASPNFSDELRKRFKGIILHEFTNSNSIVIVQSVNSGKEGYSQSVNEYLDKLRFTNHYRIVVVQSKNENGKISELTVTEN